MKSAIFYGLDQPLLNVIQQSPYQCPTGNCTWPVFEALAIRSRCANLTSELERIASNGTQYSEIVPDDDGSELPSNGTAFRLPNGLYIDNQNGWIYGDSATENNQLDPKFVVVMTTLGTTDASETITMQDLDTLIWSMSMVRVTPDSTNSKVAWPNLPLSATECALYYCVRSYKIIVTGGTLQMKDEIVSDAFRVQDSWQPRTFIQQSSSAPNESIEFNSYFSIIPRTDLTLLSPTSGNKFNVSQEAVDSISSDFQSTFASYQHYGYLVHGEGKWQNIYNGYYLNASQPQFAPSIMQALVSSEDLDGTFTALATSMSNAIRRGADESFNGVSSTVTGEKGTVVTLYNIVWPWISLHVVVTAAGLVFLVMTIRENQRHGHQTPVWKSNSLATLSRGAVVKDILTGSQSVKQMKKTANVTRVRLLEKENYLPSLEETEYGPLETEEGS